ncbi:MAG: phosphatidylserine/phosphatidylglycerophosphate/cardiolipin synthase family protein [Elainellaceae cyanobacterium]
MPLVTISRRHFSSRARFRITTWSSTVVIVAALLFWRWRHAPSLDLPPPLPQHPAIQVYFNHAESSRYEHPYRGQLRQGHNLEAVIVEAIASAQSSVDLAVQEINLPAIASALVARQRAGVRVRVILENQYHRTWSGFSAAQIAALTERDRHKYDEFLRLAQSRTGSPSPLAQHDAVALLTAAGVPVLDDTADGSKGSGLMHHKFVIVDEQRVLTGSANFTLSGLHGDLDSDASLGNANHLLNIASASLAQIFTQEFEIMWGDGPGGQPDSQFGLQKPYRGPQTVALGDTQIELQFSPTSPTRPWGESVNGLAGRWLERASQSIDLALFVFSDQQLSAALQAPHRSGVPIRALIDGGFAYRPYSEGLDLLGVALPNAQCRYDEGNAPWLPALTAVGVPALPDGDVLHHKFAVLDGQRVLTGSQNWSEAANARNDEALLAIASPIVAAHFQQEFDRLYGRASIGVPGWLMQKIEQARSRCARAQGE